MQLLSLYYWDSPASIPFWGNRYGHLSITDVHVQNIGDSIELSFYCTPYLSLRKERIIVTPILADNIHQLRFPSFVIIGKRGKKTFIRSSDYLRNIKLINSDQAFLYNSIVKYEEWMNGSTLSFNSLTKCCLKESVPTVVEVKEKIFEDKTGEEVKKYQRSKGCHKYSRQTVRSLQFPLGFYFKQVRNRTYLISCRIVFIIDRLSR